LGQSRTLLNKGFFRTANFCLRLYGGYRFRTTTEAHVEGGHSKVDYVGSVGGEPVVFIEVNSPSVMKVVGDFLPPRAFKLKWLRDQPLVLKIFQKVKTPVLRCNTDFDNSCKYIGCFISGPEEDGMALPYVPQLLDRLPSHQRW